MTLTASFGHKISLHVVLFRKQRTRTYYDYIRGILRQAAAIYLQRRSEISAATHTYKGNRVWQIYPPSSDPPSSQGISGKRKQQRRYVKSKLQKTASLYYCSQITWCSTRAHTHLHPARYLDTSERVAWIAFSSLSLITRCQNSKSGRYRLTSGSKLIG